MKEFAQGLLDELKTVASTRIFYLFVGAMAAGGTSLKSIFDQIVALGGFQ